MNIIYDIAFYNSFYKTIYNRAQVLGFPKVCYDKTALNSSDPISNTTTRETLQVVSVDNTNLRPICI